MTVVFWAAANAGSQPSPAASATRIEKFVPNVAPETIITGGPADSSAATPSRVHFSWTGTDADGSVDHFDFIMVDHPRSKDSMGPGGTDPVIITVPLPDDSRWTPTTATDSLFVAAADTLRRNPRPGPGESTADVLQRPFERWHTFFIRAVDDAGTPDPTPAYRSFNAQTLAPTVRLLPPVVPGQVLVTPPVVVFRWDGKDPLNEHAFLRPVASRYVIIPSKIDINIPGFPFVSYPESLYTLPQRFAWSPWRAWDLPDGAGRMAVITDLERAAGTSRGYYIFAVQAMDEAGAITPVFDSQLVGLNNVALVQVRDTAGPLLLVKEEFLGTHIFIGGSNPLRMDIAAGQTIAFRWSADASRYGGTITGYRYGWDLVEPENDQEWSPWSSSSAGAPAQTFAGGVHRFFLQARDDTESRIEVVFELTVQTATRSRDVLWVDDTDHPFDEVTENAEHFRWLSVFQQLTEASHLRFDPELDVYDIRNNRGLPPSLRLLFDYKAVVWSVRSGRNGSTGLRRTAQFFDPFLSYNWNSGRNFTILNLLLANDGRLWINGYYPAQQLWPDQRAGAEPLPVNVTHWDDPRQPHRGIDSVGTTSLLYKMGVEMFDVGSTVAVWARSTSKHYCYGLRPAAPGVPTLQLGSDWSQAGGGRTNIEIYDMPGALASLMPPVRPPPGKTKVLYTYVSHVPEDSSQNIFYPVTADKQPMFLVTKTAPDDPYYNLALCGFEPYYLDSISHAQLARHVLLQEMGLDPTPVFLRQLSAVASSGSVRIRWEVEASSDPAEFRLLAKAGEAEWTVPFRSVGPREFAATDESPHLAAAGTVTYSLYAQEAGAPWVLLGQETVVLTGPPRVVQLLPPRPNPFNPRVVIPFVLPAKAHVRLAIYAPDGRRITLLLDAIRPAGPGSVLWDGTDALGRSVASGLYLARLEAGGTSLSEKVLLMK